MDPNARTLFFGAASPSGAGNFLTLIRDSSTNIAFRAGVTVDSANKKIYTGIAQESSESGFVKIDAASGSVDNYYLYRNDGGAQSVRKAHYLDGFLYFGGSASDGTTTRYMAGKLNTGTGSLTYFKTSNVNSYAQDCAVGSDGTVYLTGNYSVTSAEVGIFKLDSSYNAAWSQARLGSGTDYGFSIDVSGSSVGVAAAANTSQPTIYLHLSRHSTSTGALNSSFAYRSTAGTDIQVYPVSQEGLRIGPNSGAFYVLGERYSSGYATYSVFLAKIDMSTGSVLFTRYPSPNTGGYSSNIYIESLTLDASENIYVAGYANRNNKSDGLVLKYDSSGNLLWQRRIVPQGDYSASRVRAVKHDGNGGIALQIDAYSTSVVVSEIGVLRMPDDGSLLASNAVVAIEASTLSIETTNTLTQVTNYLSSGSPSVSWNNITTSSGWVGNTLTSTSYPL